MSEDEWERNVEDAVGRIKSALDAGDPWLKEFIAACAERDSRRDVISRDDFELYQAMTAWHRDPEGNERNPDVDAWVMEEGDFEEFCRRGIHRYTHYCHYGYGIGKEGEIYECEDCEKEVKVPGSVE